MKDKREHYRTIYPPHEIPLFQHRAGSYSVIDLSEGGFSFELIGACSFKAGEELSGMIVCPGRSTCHVVGRLLRINFNSLTVQLLENHWIILPITMKEQLYLIKKKLL